MGLTKWDPLNSVNSAVKFQANGRQPFIVAQSRALHWTASRWASSCLAFAGSDLCRTLLGDLDGQYYGELR